MIENQLTVLVVGNDPAVKRMFQENGYAVAEGATHMENINLMVFTGGEDVTPNLYGEAAHPKTQNNLSRDLQEIKYFRLAQDYMVPCIGICRGGQFLNVMSGGALYQHVTMHTQSHDMTLLDSGETIQATSTHHQMFSPSEDAIILAVAHQKGAVREYMANRSVVSELIPDGQQYEVVQYAHTQSICFQPHPEYVKKGDPLQEYFFQLCDMLLLGVVQENKLAA